MTTNNKHNGKQQSATFPRACALALTALVTVGCGADDSEDLSSAALESDVPCGETETDGGAIAPEIDGGKNTPTPNGAYFASVTANGTGCPAGTWETELSEDGSNFVTKFKGYVASVDETSSVAVKNCQLAVKLHSPVGMSYRVKHFGLGGSAFLEEGVKARFVAQYYFQGNPVAAEQVRTDLVGPVDDAFAFEDRSASASNLWSPCDLDRDLNINTTVQLQNSEPKRKGEVKIEDTLGMRLEWRKCDETPEKEKPTEPEPTEPDHDGSATPETEEPDAVEPDAPKTDAGVRKPRRPRMGGWFGRLRD